MPSRFRQWLLDPVLIVGAIVSTAGPIALYQRGAQGDFSFLVGLILFIVTLQIQAIIGEKSRLNRETLFGRIAASLESSPPAAMDAYKILVSMERAEQLFRKSPIRPTYHLIIRRISGELAELADGWMSLSPSEKRVVVGITQQARHSLHAVSIEGPRPTFWASGTGRLYFDAQCAAVARGVAIKRVIVYTDWSDQLDRVAQEQRKAGIDIHRVHARLLTDAQDRVNIAIWDDFCGFETTSTPDGDTISNRFTIREAEMDRQSERFARVWALREPLPDSTPFERTQKSAATT
jgi:hypothetical protein